MPGVSVSILDIAADLAATGLPAPPAGFAYLIGADGLPEKGADGAYLLGAA